MCRNGLKGFRRNRRRRFEQITNRFGVKHDFDMTAGPVLITVAVRTSASVDVRPGTSGARGCPRPYAFRATDQRGYTA
jgi:hypothetical protein